MKMQRRDLFKLTASLAAAGITINNPLFAEEDKPNPKSQKFLLYVHFGSGCGAANGLVQPMKAGAWPKGFFYGGKTGGSLNEHLNKHTAAGGLVFHEYIKFLKDMSDDMCLVNGNPRSLDHNVARIYQQRGTAIASFAPEWSMGVSQFMQTATNKNPMCITRGSKTQSVQDITTLTSDSVPEFKTATRDATYVPGTEHKAIWDTLSKRYQAAKLDTVLVESSLGMTAQNQIGTLLNGLPQLDQIKAETDALTASLADAEVLKIIASTGVPDKDNVAAKLQKDFRDALVLAGALAKSGLASGMSLDVGMGDLHTGGSCVDTPRTAAGAWAQIMQLWKWIKSQNLQNDVMIVVGQEFARSPYNNTSTPVKYINPAGKEVTFNSPGRDHGACMGMMFINDKVPKAARIGNVADNMTPVAGKDLLGGIDTSVLAYNSENIVGSMLMRIFDDIFPTERMVRKHWPTFVEIPHILDAP